MRKGNRLRGLQLLLEALEDRVVLSSVTTYHNDIASTGQNLTETVLTRANVNATTFGKLYAYPVDGQVYAQPLVQPQVNITTGPQIGLHDVLFVATQHDSLYALDASTGDSLLLWKRSFFDTILPGATTVTSVPNGDTGSGDITVEVGITGTPVIDPASNTLYVVAKSKETVAGVDHYVQRLHAVNMSNGTDRVAPLVIGDTSLGNNNNTSVYVYGTGDGSVTDPYNGTGKSVVQFNALREHQRGALTLVGGTIYVPWASHGDNGPYHGWVVGFDTATLAIKGVFNTTPNGGLGGIWQAGGALSSDGTNLYFETGNGTFDGSNGNDSNVPGIGTITGLDANGFPVSGNYGDSFVKVGLDPTTSPTTQNINGWGLKVLDYFTPFDQQYLNVRDMDVGSAAALVLPDSVGSVAHPHLLIGSGKEGIIYLIDRENMGKYGNDDAVVQKVGGQLSGSLDTAAYFQNQIYYVEGYGGNAKIFSISNAVMSNLPTSRSADTYAFAGSTPSVSANGTQDGIVWDIDRGTNQLRAYSSDSYATELYNSAQAAGNRDALGAAVKFQVPTVVNGHVYVGSGTGAPNNFINVYGLIKPPDAAPAAPTNLKATAVSGSQINLTWTPNDHSPNRADGYKIEQSSDGLSGWALVATSGALTTSYAIGGLALSSTYYFRICASNVIGSSDFSNISSATTSNQAASLNFSAGFGNLINGLLSFNGGAMVSGTRLQVTDENGWEARSIFSTNAQDITKFNTRFQFQISPGGNTADGFAFVIQGVSPTAVGGLGGGLGYGPDSPGGPTGIDKSLAIKFDIYNNAGEGSNSTGLYTNGVSPSTPADDLTPSGVDLHSGDVMEVAISYDGATFLLSITDTSTQATFTKSYSNVNIQGLVGGGSAYVGFTGGTGGLAALQEVLTWTYTPIVAVPPGIPANLKATLTGYTAGSTTTVPLGSRITWDPVSGATGYKLERKLGTTGTYTQVATINDPLKPYYQDDGLATQSTYVYRVCARNDKGDGAYSKEVLIITPALAPTPTQGIAKNVTDTSITLSWQDNANNEDGFQIFRSMNAGQFLLLTSLPTNTATAPSTVVYTDTTVQPTTRYDYHIQAFNLAGYSDFAGVTTYTAPSQPSILGVILTGTLASSLSAVPLGATVSWTAVTGATGYKVERKLNTGGTYSLVGQVNSTTLNLHEDGLAPGSLYVYRVRAFTPNIDGAASAEVPISTPSLPPAPAQARTTITSPSSLVLSWTDTASNEDGFRLFRSQNSGAFLLISTLAPNTVTFTDSSLQNATEYDYRIQAFNLAGYSDFAATTSYTAPAQVTIAGTTLTGTVANSLAAVPLGATISWYPVDGATSYKVERSLGATGSFAQVGTVLAPSISFHEDGLASASTYIYRVRACTPYVDGPASASASINTPKIPSSPVGVGAYSRSSTSLAVTWQESDSQVEGFQVYRSQGGGPFTLVGTVSASMSSSQAIIGYLDNGLSPITTYQYRIQAYSLAGFSAPVLITGVTDPGVPLTPLNVKAQISGYSGNSIKPVPVAALISWDSVPYASMYQIERSVSGYTHFVNIGQVSASGSSFNDQNLPTNGSYDYRVIAQNTAGQGPVSSLATATIPTAPSAPTQGQITKASAGEITLSWQDNSQDEAGFQVLRSVNGQNFTLLAALPSQTSAVGSPVLFTDTDVKPSTSYAYRIQAYNVARASAYTSAATLSAPSTPDGFIATTNGQAVILEWNPPAGVVGSYVLFRSTNPGSGIPSLADGYVAGITGSSYTDSNVVPGVTYYYRLAALNGANSSPLTAEVTATAPVVNLGVRINFTNTTLHVPAGFVNDTGEVYGPKANGLTFGWSLNNKSNARDRNSPISKDEQHDSFITLLTRKRTSPSWSIAVPNGTYMVHLAAGDPAQTRGSYKISVNGFVALGGKVSRKSRWVENTVVVTVSNGKITLANARGSMQNKIDFIEITKLQ